MIYLRYVTQIHCRNGGLDFEISACICALFRISDGHFTFVVSNYTMAIILEDLNNDYPNLNLHSLIFQIFNTQ